MLAIARHAALAATVATATLGFAAAPASTAEPDAGRTATVRHADLDLASAAGVATLGRRVKLAVTTVCGRADPRDLTAQEQEKTCRAHALASAEPGVQLAIADARSGTRMAQNDRGATIVTTAR